MLEKTIYKIHQKKQKNTKITAKLEAKEVLLKLLGQIDKECMTQQFKWSTEKKLTRNSRT